MHTIWQALAWKEWHEHKWKLAAVLGVLLLCIAMLWSTQQSFFLSNIQFALLLPIIPLSILIATSTAAQERSRGTMAFLSALPVSTRRVAIAKLSAGLATCLIPVLIALALLIIGRAGWDSLGIEYPSLTLRASDGWRGPFDISNWFLATACGITLWVVSLFLWSAAAGVNRADEVSAGAAALVAIAGVWLGFVGMGSFWLGDVNFPAFLENHPSLVALVYAAAPGGFAQSQPLTSLGEPLAWCTLGLFIAVHAGLAIRFMTQFGRVDGQGAKSNRAAKSARPRLNWLASPHRSALSAIAWKQFRESGPVVLAGLGGVAMIVVAGLLLTAKSQRNFSEAKDVLVASAFFSCVYVGGFTTLVVGIGVFLRDLEPGIHTFWRSRPIDPNLWYWAKFATGLAIVGLTFLLPMLIVPSLASPNQFRDIGGGPGILTFQLAVLTAIVATYALAVAATCLTRSAVYATILAVLGLYLGALAPATILFAFEWLTSQTRPTFPLDEPEGQPILIGSFLMAAIASAIVGWLVIRSDWGRQRR